MKGYQAVAFRYILKGLGRLLQLFDSLILILDDPLTPSLRILRSMNPNLLPPRSVIRPRDLNEFKLHAWGTHLKFNRNRLQSHRTISE